MGFLIHQLGYHASFGVCLLLSALVNIVSTCFLFYACIYACMYIPEDVCVSICMGCFVMFSLVRTFNCIPVCVCMCVREHKYVQKYYIFKALLFTSSRLNIMRSFYMHAYTNMYIHTYIQVQTCLNITRSLTMHACTKTQIFVQVCACMFVPHHNIQKNQFCVCIFLL